MMTLTIVYDNRPFDKRLKTAWGYAAVVETGESTLLFDTGGDGPTLIGNMRVLGFDPRDIDIIVLSHNHADHTGGLESIVSANNRSTVYAPASFAASIKARLANHDRVVEVSGPMRIAERVRVTGDLGGVIAEQALVLETGAALAIVTGCAHPGIAAIVRQVASWGDVRTIAGGFHMKDNSSCEIGKTVAALMQIGVRRVAPSHCTGDEALGAFEEAYTPGFTPAGAGAVIAFADPPGAPVLDIKPYVPEFDARQDVRVGWYGLRSKP